MVPIEVISTPLEAIPWVLFRKFVTLEEAKQLYYGDPLEAMLRQPLYLAIQAAYQ